jgi:Xaa-Pro aminopeptidase
MLAKRIAEVQESLRREGVDGWLFQCFHAIDPISLDLLAIPRGRLITRRCYYLVPAEGAPRRLVHALEPAMLDHLPGEKSEYLTWQVHRQRVGELLAGCSKVAAQYSPDNALPSLSWLDAGTAELVRGTGAELVSSAELVQEFAAVWSAEQLESHRRAAVLLRETVHAAFAYIGDALRAGRALDEYAVQQFILARFETDGLEAEDAPIVGVNANAADPHYQPGPEGSLPIEKGDFVLIDLFAREKTAGSVYADITWCGVCAESPSERHARLFSVAAAARDAAIELLRSRWPHEAVAGYELDDACREVIVKAGYGERFIHRTGHSIGIEVHGHGANLDNLETHDTRKLRAMTGFSIEPGIYLTGDFGVRTEVDIALTENEVEVTGGEPQRELIAILG